MLFAALMGGMGSMMGGGMMRDGTGGMLLAVLFWGLLLALPVGLAVLVLDRVRR